MSGHTLTDASQLVSATQQGNLRVNVDIDETRAHDLSMRVDYPVCLGGVQVADGGNPVTYDANIRREGFTTARAIDNGSPVNDIVKLHQIFSML
jgi:hypothetical protein